jgi:hypothetical protein
MKAPPHFTVLIHGTTERVVKRINIDQGLGYLLTRLLSGQDVAESAFASWGLTVHVERDCDQGDEPVG